MTQQTQRTVVTPTKSMGIALLLTVLLGPLGMLYSTVLGALVMIVISVVVAVVTLGLGLLLTWPISTVWAAIATSRYNRRLLEGHRQY